MSETPTETMPALLRRWSELAPKECERSSSGYYLPQASADRLVWVSEGLDWMDRAVIQAAAEQAIEARIWRWSVMLDRTDSSIDESQWGDYWASVEVYGRPGCLHVKRANSPAAALLSAYIAALTTT